MDFRRERKIRGGSKTGGVGRSGVGCAPSPVGNSSSATPRELSRISHFSAISFSMAMVCVVRRGPWLLRAGGESLGGLGRTLISFSFAMSREEEIFL